MACVVIHFFQPIRDILQFSYKTDKKQLQILVGFAWIRPESPRHCDEFSMMCKNIFGNTARKLRISHELVKSTPNACTNQSQINRNMLLFLTICGVFSHARYKKVPSMLPGQLVPK